MLARRPCQKEDGKEKRKREDGPSGGEVMRDGGTEEG